MRRLLLYMIFGKDKAYTEMINLEQRRMWYIMRLQRIVMNEVTLSAYGIEWY